MIFLSHTHKDKDIVEPFANRLADIYGRENIFYDSWSIQPSDGIIDKMNEGLANSDYFFFFVSKDSLQSNMVKFEWQNALFKSTKGHIRFIPIKLDQCEMPNLLQQTLWLDVYNNGFEEVVLQMIDVVNSDNTYHNVNKKFENVRARLKILNCQKIEIEFYAVKIMEPISKYLILFSSQGNDISCNFANDFVLYDYKKDFAFPTENGNILVNVLSINLQRPTTPDFPIKVIIESKTSIEFINVMKAKNNNIYEKIPYDYVWE